MFTLEQEEIRDMIMHTEPVTYEFESVELKDTFIDFFITDEWIYERVYNKERTEFTEHLIAKVVE